MKADPIQGESFAHTLADAGAPSKHTEQYWECIGNRAFYRDGWEVVTTHEARKSFKNDHWQLFHAETDVNQLRDVSAEHPDKVNELVAAWEAAAKANRVIRLPTGSAPSTFASHRTKTNISATFVFFPEPRRSNACARRA